MRKLAFGLAAFVVASLIFTAAAIDPASAAGLVSDPSWLFANVVALPALKQKLADLTQAATVKRAEIKDDTAQADVTRIEGEHAALLTQIDALRAEIATAEKAEADAAAAAAAAAAATRAAQTTDTAAMQAAAADAARAAVAAERQRSETITSLGARFEMAPLAAEAIRAGTAVEVFRNTVLDKLAERTGGVTMPVIQVTRDEAQTRVENVIQYLLDRSAMKPLTDKTKEYRGTSLLDLARMALEWNNLPVRGLTKNEIAERGLHSTSDFPHILANVANKSLLAAYNARPQSFRGWSRRMSLTDFKAISMLRMGQNPQLKLVNEHGEFKRGTIAEGKETISLKTYGIVVGITRQVIINDDLGAFTNIPARFGQSAATLESDLVYGKLLENPTLVTDSKAVFHTDHNNIAPVAAAPSIDSISLARVRMAKQKDLDAKTVLNLSPSFIIIPPELEQVTLQLVAGSIVPAVATNVIPEWVRQLTPVSEPRLSVGIDNVDAGVSQGGSTTQWFMAAASGDADSIIHATLDGQDGPYTESRVGFDVDGVEVKCRHDFGVAAGDYRGLQRNAGA